VGGNGEGKGEVGGIREGMERRREEEETERRICNPSLFSPGLNPWAEERGKRRR
jgi:hypothetical protein